MYKKLHQIFCCINLISIIFFPILSESQINSPVFPLIWRRSKHRVATDYVNAQIDIHLKPPCEVIKSSFLNPTNISNGFNYKFEKETCEKLYNKLVKETMHKKCGPFQSSSKPRRDIVSFVSGVVFTSIIVIASVMFGSYVKSQIGISDHSLTEIEISKLDQQIHEKVVHELINMQHQIDQIKHVSENRFLTSILSARFLQAEQIINEAFVADSSLPISFQQLFPNISICEHCPSDLWHFEKCYFRSMESPLDSRLQLNVNTVKIDPKYDIIRADPFHIVAPDQTNKDNLCITTYSGPKYAVINKESKCVRDITFDPINDYQSPLIFHSIDCKENINYVKATWKPYRCMKKDLITPEEIVQIKSDDSFVYFYCYMQNITVHGSTFPCKNQVYRMKRGQNLTINGQTVTFPTIRINSWQNLHDELNEILVIKMFNSFNSSMNLHDLTSMVEKEKHLVEQLVNNFLHSNLFYIVTIVIVIITIFLFIICCIQHFTHQNYRRVAMEHYQLATRR